MTAPICRPLACQELYRNAILTGALGLLLPQRPPDGEKWREMAVPRSQGQQVVAPELEHSLYDSGCCKDKVQSSQELYTTTGLQGKSSVQRWRLSPV